jgi:hypothetical protein
MEVEPPLTPLLRDKYAAPICEHMWRTMPRLQLLRLPPITDH